MIKMMYKNAMQATFDEPNTKWISETHPNFADLLNDLIPDEIYAVDSIFAFEDDVYGRDGIALREIKQVFGAENIKVIENHSKPAPPEEPGVVY
jgi:hypothetical protein